MPEVRFQDVHQWYGAVKVFEGINLTCPEHTYLCLLGPSGCGKTTLMRMLAGLDSPKRGSIMIAGRQVNDLAPSQREIGLAFQNYALYPHLTVARNLEFPLRAPVWRGRYSEDEILRRVTTVAQMLKIDWLLNRSINQLSGGQQQRVSLGRSIIRDPKVLLLDEPVTHLDARLRYEMRTELKLLHERLGATTIHVTHDQQEALAVADQIAVLRNGRLEQQADPMTLYNQPATAFVASFVGDPPMSLVSGSIGTNKGQPSARVGDVDLPLPPDLARQAQGAPSLDVLIGLRPRNVELASEADNSCVPGSVYMHEKIGRELQLMLSLNGDLVRYRTSAPLQAKVGDKIAVKLTLDGARLFDRATGRTLAPN
jgi:multiple sugar transport system ATP-binding protein